MPAADVPPQPPLPVEAPPWAGEEEAPGLVSPAPPSLLLQGQLPVSCARLGLRGAASPPRAVGRGYELLAEEGLMGVGRAFQVGMSPERHWHPGPDLYSGG